MQVVDYLFSLQQMLQMICLSYIKHIKQQATAASHQLLNFAVVSENITTSIKIPFKKWCRC